jgi:hypothetical protein
MPEIGTYSLSGGRRPARKRASSDPTGTFSQRFACVASEPNGVEHHGFMKPSSWDKQLGLALPQECAANQSGQTNNPSENDTGLDVSHNTRASPEGGGKYFFLDILFHRMSVIACGCNRLC